MNKTTGVILLLILTAFVFWFYQDHIISNWEQWTDKEQQWSEEERHDFFQEYLDADDYQRLMNQDENFYLRRLPISELRGNPWMEENRESISDYETKLTLANMMIEEFKQSPLACDAHVLNVVSLRQRYQFEQPGRLSQAIRNAIGACRNTYEMIQDVQKPEYRPTNFGLFVEPLLWAGFDGDGRLEDQQLKEDLINLLVNVTPEDSEYTPKKIRNAIQDN